MKRATKLALAGAVGLTLTLCIGVALLIAITGRKGSGDVEQWIGAQIVAIANGHLNPQVSFASLDYEYPGTVRLTGFRLTAPDPRAPGATIDLLSADAATVVLAGIPRVGEPIVIESVILERPSVQAVAVGEGSEDFVGFSNLLREPTSVQAAGAAPPPKLSDAFAMKLVELRDARLTYDPRIAGTEPMVLDGINTRLDISPDAAGLYAVKTSLARAPVFAMALAGKLNLDHMTADELVVEVTATLGAAEQSFLPPQIQKLLSVYEIKGKATARVTGHVPVQNLASSRLTATVTLTDGNAAWAEYQVPIESLSLSAALADGRVDVRNLVLTALGGMAKADGTVLLNDALDAWVEVTAENLLVQDTLRQAARDAATPKYWGRLNAQVSAAVPARSLMAVLAEASAATRPADADGTQLAAAPAPQLPADWGTARVRMDRAQLVRLPVIGEIGQAMRGGRPAVPGRRGDGDERVLLELAMDGELVRVRRMDYVGPMVAARGSGTVSLRGKLDLLVNGGPIEKVEQMLGDDVGSALAGVTDQVVAYRVTGTAAEPRVSVEAGRGLDKVGRDVGGTVQRGAGQVGRGLNDVGRNVGGLLDPNRAQRERQRLQERQRELERAEAKARPPATTAPATRPAP